MNAARSGLRGDLQGVLFHFLPRSRGRIGIQSRIRKQLGVVEQNRCAERERQAVCLAVQLAELQAAGREAFEILLQLVGGHDVLKRLGVVIIDGVIEAVEDELRHVGAGARGDIRLHLRVDIRGGDGNRIDDDVRMRCLEFVNQLLRPVLLACNGEVVAVEGNLGFLRRMLRLHRCSLQRRLLSANRSSPNCWYLPRSRCRMQWPAATSMSIIRQALF